MVWVREAIDAARDAGLDLIEVAPEANPPVCRIMDWGRYRYEQKQREREQRKKQRGTDVKQLRLRPMTGQADFAVTKRKAELFLRDGHKVRVEVRFRGREITHQDLGVNVLMRLAGEVSELAEVEQRPSMEGRKMFILVAPTAETLKDLQRRKDAAAAAGQVLQELSADIEEDLDDDDDESRASAPEADGEEQAAASEDATPSASATDDTATAP